MKIFDRLTRLASLALLLCVAAPVQAADVDLAAAKNVAKSFMTRQVAEGRLKAADVSNLQLVKAEASVFNPKAVDYYVFNTDKSYVVVAGDDQAPEVLMYGVSGKLDMDKIPPAMKWLLNKYKYQIDGLKAGTLVPNNYSPKATTAVAPLVTCTWDQTAPYYNHTPTSGSTHAYTGCPATSLSMCFYLYKWPKTYPALEAIPANNYYGYLAAPALEEKAADWDNILEHYGTWYDDNGSSHSASYNSTQAEAISWLMRYVGQACNMGYSTSGSGATDPEILEACHTFGYTDAQLYTLNELVQSGYGYTNGPAQYTDAQWNEWMLAELHAGRPIEYLAYDCSDSSQPAGHAFNVFGCDANGKYYVNWGWSGDSNGYCTLHNFTTATGATGQSGSYVFNYGEAMIINIAPPAGAMGPQITVNPTSLEFEGYVGETYTKTFTVTGANLEGDITISKQGSNNITVTPTTITAANAANGVEVTVTYKPTNVGNASAVLTLSSEGASDVTLNVTGTAQAKVPTINVDPTSLSFNANLSSTMTKTINVTGLFLTNDVTVTLNDQNGVFSVTPTTITAANAANGVPVTVSFSSENEGTFTGSLTIASTGAESKTVALTATARDGGTASDAYLNIAKYATIDEAGATVSSMLSIYKYTEYNNDNCAWLTVSTYGAKQVDANQNWLETGSLNQYNNTWSATDIFLGQNAYFGTSTAYSIYGSGSQTFYVTNCTQAKALVKDGSSSKATLAIYECTVNADGSLTAATTATDSQQGGASGTAVITSATLDASKVYKVQLTGGGSYPDLLEVGFKTPIEGIETPVATAATEVGTNEFTANWNACEGATSYTLRVMPKPEITEPELLISEDFSAFTNANGSTNLSSSLDDYMQNAGWTGSYVYERAGGLQLGSNSNAGSLTSPQLDLTGSNGKVTVKFNAYSYSSSYSPSTLYVSMNGESANQQNVSVAYGTTGAEYTVVLDCNAVTGQTVSFRTSARRYRVVLTNVEIYAGDLTSTAKATGEMLFPGITDTHYTVTGLEPATTYIYDVKAVYGDKESNWSNQIEVTTAEEQEQGTPLAEILASGVDGTEYVVSNDLAVADVADYANYAFLTDGEGNWIGVTATDDIFQAFVDNSTIKGGTLKATLSGIELNPLLTATAQPQGASTTVGYDIEKIYLDENFGPKVNQVVDVVGYWNASDGALRAYEPGNGVQGKSLTLDTSWGAASNTLVNGKRYIVRCAINIKEAWHTPAGIMPRDYDYDFQNYLGYALRLPDAPTAIGTIGLDSYNEVVNVYNAQGQLVRRNVKAGEATLNLPAGIYIVGNKKVVVK